MSTLTVFADTTDGYLQTAGSYTAARNGIGTQTTDTSGVSLKAGQDGYAVSNTGYDVFESFLSFPTSSLGSGVTVSAAALSVWPTALDTTSSTFTLRARLYSWSAPLTFGSAWVAGGSLGSQTLLCHLASGSLTTGAYRTLTDDAFAANVNTTGDTQIVMSSNRVENGTTPTLGAGEFVTFSSSDTSGTTQDPKLVITYAPTAVSGTSAVTFAAMTVAASGAETYTGTSDVTFGAMTVDIEAFVANYSGTAAVTFGAMTVAASGSETFTGTAPVTFGAMTVAGSGTETFSGTAAVTFGAMTVAATGAKYDIFGPADVTFGAMTVAAAGTYVAPPSPVGAEFWLFDANTYSGAYTRTELFNGAKNGTWRHPWDDVGQGQFDLASTDAKATSENLAVDNVIGCYLDGVLRYAFLVETPQAMLAAPQGKSGQPWTVKGRGIEAYLDKAQVYPGGWASSIVRPVPWVVEPEFPPINLAAAASAGATNIKVTSVSGLTLYGIYQIQPTNSGEATDTIMVTAIGTAGAGGTGLTVELYGFGVGGLSSDHASGAVVAQAVPWPHTLGADTAINATSLPTTDNTYTTVGALYAVHEAGGPVADTTEVVRVASVGAPYGVVGHGATGLTFTNDAGGNTLRLVHHQNDVVSRVLGSVLAAASSVGATNIKVADVTDYAVGMQVTIGGMYSYETRTLTAVGTAGSGGTGLSFATPLVYSHSSGDFVPVTQNIYSTRRTFEAPAGAILSNLIQEAQTGRGELPALDQTFTPSMDTAGNGWASNVVIEVAAGTSLLTVWQQLIGLGMDSAVRLDPTGTIYLDAWDSDPSTDLSDTVVLHQGRHIRGPLRRELRQDQWRSRVLVEGANGTYVEIVSAAETPKNRRDGYLSFSNTDDIPTLTIAGTKYLITAAASAAPINVPVQHGSHDDGLWEPYADFVPGDTVGLDVPGTWDRSPQKVVAVVVQQNEAAGYAVQLDLGSPEYSAAAELKRQLAALQTRATPGSSLSTGSVGGDSIADGSIGAAKLDPTGDYTMESLTITGADAATQGVRFDGGSFGVGTVPVVPGYATVNDEGVPTVSVQGVLAAATGLIVPTSVTPPAVGVGTYTNGWTQYDETNGRWYIMMGTTGHYWARTAGVEVPVDVDGVDETVCPRCGRRMELGQRAVVRFDHRKSDGALHGLWEHESCPD